MFYTFFGSENIFAGFSTTGHQAGGILSTLRSGEGASDEQCPNASVYPPFPTHFQYHREWERERGRGKGPTTCIFKGQGSSPKHCSQSCTFSSFSKREALIAFRISEPCKSSDFPLAYSADLNAQTLPGFVDLQMEETTADQEVPKEGLPSHPGCLQLGTKHKMLTKDTHTSTRPTTRAPLGRRLPST